ncbi:DUF86 domain-containing protein [Candidatus Margulisiibacteriota bacterium]
MKNELGDKVRLQHILDAIKEIESYTQGVDEEKFISLSMMKYACIKLLEIIGEAASRLTPSLKSKYTDIRWAEIVGLRNILIHEYFGVNEKVVWEIIETDLPSLKIFILKVLKDIK